MFIFLKKFVPQFFLNRLRGLRDLIYHMMDVRKPYLNKIKYRGFDLYYSKGNGLINRIRFGSPDRIFERSFSEKIVQEIQTTGQKDFVDVGANIGLISLYVLAQLKKLKIYAFEPGVVQHALFSTTIFANQISNRIILSNKALDEDAGSKKFISHNDMHNSGDGFIDTERGRGDMTVVNVETTTLDILWNQKGKPDIGVIKIDTEGAELRILRGAEHMISSCKPTLFLEISLLNLKNYPYNHKDVYIWLRKHGYQLFTINEELCDEHNFDEFIASEDSYIARAE